MWKFVKCDDGWEIPRVSLPLGMTFPFGQFRIGKPGYESLRNI